MNRRKFIKAGGLITTATAIAPALSADTLSGRGNKMIPASTIEAFKVRIKPISAEERASRIKNARKLMAENKLDAILIEGGTSLKYFTGVRWGRSERLFAFILTLNGEPFYIAPKFEEARAHEQTGNAVIYTWQENESPYDLIKDVLKERKIDTGALGLEETTRYFISEGIRKVLPSMLIKNADMVTAGCRSVKSVAEIEIMQIANDITAEVYKASVKRLTTGMTEREFADIISEAFAEFGLNGGALVLFGEASAYPHGLVKENHLKDNDVVLIDGGCELEGYESDITRMWVFGTPSDKALKNLELVRKAQDESLRAARPGVEAQAVDAAARRVITENGYGPAYKFFTHRLGHGIGMDGHEWYYLVGGNHYRLKPGNMFSNEPGIYIPGEFGIRLEDEMLITENGARLLLPQQDSFVKMF